MLIIKYITLFLIFLCSTYIGILISKKYVNRVLELKEMKIALNIFETKVRLTYEPVPKIFNEIGNTVKENVAKIFKLASEKMENVDAKTAWIESVETIENSMNKEDIDIIKGLGNLLGQVDAEGQISRIKIIDSFLDKQIEKAENLKRKNGKMYKTLGITAGLALVIVLI